MKRITPSPWAVVALLLLAVSAAMASPPFFGGRTRLTEPEVGNPAVPAIQGQQGAQVSLAPPDGNVVLIAFRAEGFQIYECQPKKGVPTEFEWAFKAPEAILFDDLGEKAGTHGAGPIWEANDGSKITAAKMAALDAPGPRAIPWLLLQVKSKEGAGIFSKVTYIQRVDTWAGLPPADGATKASLGKMVRVKYEATYRFYGFAAEKQPNDDEGAAQTKKLDGFVTRDKTMPGNPVVEVDRYDTLLKEDHLRILTSLLHLRRLRLDRACDVTDAGLKHVAGCKHLKDLALKHLSALKKLETLNLDFLKNVTDAGVPQIIALKDLRELNLWYTHVTDNSVAALKVSLPDCKISCPASR